MRILLGCLEANENQWCLDYGYSRHRNQALQRKFKVEQGLPKELSMWRMISFLSPLISMNVQWLLKIILVENFMQIVLYPFNIRTKHHRVPNHFLRAHVVKGIIMISFIWKESHVHCIHCFIPFVRGSSYLIDIFLDFLKVLEMQLEWWFKVN